MTVMILFATVEGQSRKVAEFAADQVRACGQEAILTNAEDLGADLDMSDVGSVILVAPVHERRHPPAFEITVGAQKAALAKCKTLFLSVSLNAAFADGLEEAEGYIKEMEMRTGFTAGTVKAIAGAVKPGSYDYFATQVVRHVLLDDRPYDPNDGPREFTNWDDLKVHIRTFLG